jgi:hypothetical protein
LYTGIIKSNTSLYSRYSTNSSNTTLKMFIMQN